MIELTFIKKELLKDLKDVITKKNNYFKQIKAIFNHLKTNFLLVLFVFLFKFKNKLKLNFNLKLKEIKSYQLKMGQKFKIAFVKCFIVFLVKYVA